MLTVLLGEDVFAKQQYLDQIILKNGLEIAKYESGQSLPKLSSLAGQSLFGAGQLHVFVGCASNYELPEFEGAAKSTAQVIFIEDSLDKRLTKTKELLKLAKASGGVQEFLAPSYDTAAKWIVSHANDLGLKIQPAAADELVRRLMGESKKTLPTLQTHQELLKLSSFAGDHTITKEMVEELTVQDLAIDLFSLLDNIGNKNKSGIIKLLGQYYDSSSEDDKALTIRLSALLADQFRSLLIVKHATEQGLSDNDLLTTTGWKSGRLFIMKKLSNNFNTKQLVDALAKFYSLDKELKNSTLPPRIVIDMIVATI